MLDVGAYLRRIGCADVRGPDGTTLRALHRAHMLAVPFENLDIHLGRPIVLDVESLFDKIVMHRRGGFCYELNGLFAALLVSLKFRVTFLSARVYERDTPGPEFDHMALLVECGERWVADVGFGDSFVDPVPFDDPGDHVEGPVRYRIDGERDAFRLLRSTEGGAWTPQYAFTLRPRKLRDYATMCRYHQNSPASSFTQKPVCSLAKPDGRVTLSGRTLIVTEKGERRERPVTGAAEYAEILKEVFGIELPEERISALALQQAVDYRSGPVA